MDVYCPKCGEPWDNDEFHEVSGLSYTEATRTFFRLGCSVLGSKCNPDTLNSERAQMSGVLADLLGDDVDGIASMSEDFGL